MESLISDCFSPIFSYLSLADLLHLRTVSRPLKQEVEKYLPKVRSLPLYLTTPRTPEEIAKYENICLLLKSSSSTRTDGTVNTDLLSDDLCFRRLPFGSSSTGAFEDLTILQNQDHFQRSNFMILNHSSMLFKFLPFIKKHCPNIEKLALVIDHCDHYLPEVSKVLEAFPAVMVLLLESTLQDSCRHYDETINNSSEERLLYKLPKLKKNLLQLSPEVYKTILALDHLKELYLFPKRQCQLWMNCRVRSLEHNFVKNLLGQLRVFHVNCKNAFKLPFNCGIEESLEELAYPSDLFLDTNSERLIFPKLNKLILYGPCWSFAPEYSQLPRPSLKFLNISHDDHIIYPVSTQNLNSFTGVENFHCRSITVSPIRNADEVEMEIVPENLKNWTIKHIQMMSGPETEGERNREVRRWSRYFVALETCTFLEPEYSVVRVSALQNE